MREDSLIIPADGIGTGICPDGHFVVFMTLTTREGEEIEVTYHFTPQDGAEFCAMAARKARGMMS